MAIRRTANVGTVKYQYRDNGFQSWRSGSNQYYNTEELLINVDHSPFSLGGSDVGGPWLLHRTGVKKLIPGSYSGGLFQGQFVPGQSVNWFNHTPAFSQVPDSELYAKGTTAIARVEPTSPAFEGATALGELLSDGLPAVTGASYLKERARFHRETGGEYLNVQFGWKPFLSDIQTFAKSVKESEKILNQYRKGSGTQIRRRYEFPEDRRTTMGTGALYAQQPMNVFLTGSITEQVYSQTWFSGAFKYYIPTSETQLGKFREWSSMANHLLGFKVTPETVWNIAPWSWAADWFANTGDVIHNISAMGRDGQVMSYGYVMDTKSVDTTYVGSYSGSTALRQTLEEWKKRVWATPYGFGVDLKSLTQSQVAILVALGLSKG
jgi:hypothetical protein